MANGLTYRVLLAFFPFLIFLMSLLGFLNLDDGAVINRMYAMLPEDIYSTISHFLAEVSPYRSTGLLSFSLIFMLYAIANSFRMATHCINKAYGIHDDRSMLAKIGISVVLMLIFTFALILMLVMLIFDETVWSHLQAVIPHMWSAFNTTTAAIGSLAVLLIVTMLIYKLACVRKLKLLQVLPGAAATVALWVAASWGFSFFISNFTNYSRIYGSIAGLFILILWLDIITLVLLTGNQINAMLLTRKRSRHAPHQKTKA
jgi:membrane protein